MPHHPDAKYWVEADHAVKNPSRVIGYGVWHDNDGASRECVQRFSITRKGGWEVALYLANTLRDDLNAEAFKDDPAKMFPFVGDPHRTTD